MTGGRFKVPEVPRNERMSMEACCGCGGPISDQEDGMPGGIACAGCRHRLCGIWCVVENAGQGPRCRHCTRMAIAISGTPDGEAQHRKVTPSRLSSSWNTEAEQIEKEAFDNAFEPTLRTQSQEDPCYICEKYTRFQLKCRACEWLTCPMCKECFDHFHGSCTQPTEADEEIPDLQTESEQDSDKVEEYWRKVRLRGLVTLRNRGSASASSSSWTPPPVAPDHWIRCKICYKCKRVTREQNARCAFCKRPCCHNCMKLMV